jgi:hypothetical protein
MRGEKRNEKRKKGKGKEARRGRLYISGFFC